MKFDLQLPKDEQTLDYRKDNVDVHWNMDDCYDNKCPICNNRKHNRRVIRDYVKDIIQEEVSKQFAEISITLNPYNKSNNIEELDFRHNCDYMDCLENIKIIYVEQVGWKLSIGNDNYEYYINHCPFCGLVLT